MSSPFSAVLLAGGKSSRMGHDKALIKIEGVTFWQRQLRILQELASTEIYLAGPQRSEWENAGCVIIPDAQENSGPLAGIAAALRQSSTDFLLALAVDLPRMTADYLRGLLHSRAEGKGIVPRGDRFEPLAAIYPKTSLEIAEQLLASGDYSLQGFVDRCIGAGMITEQLIHPADAALFLNMNTPSDLQTLSR